MQYPNGQPQYPKLDPEAYQTGKRKKRKRNQPDPAARIRYEAFISYRHLPKDRFAAEQIHKMLEHYTIPKKLRKNGKKRIGHIFRDEDELPLSADLSASIQQALFSANLLIVICSPETKNSKWVNREIDEFIRLHGRERIVAVLVDGEPEESFPPQLRYRPDPAHPGKWIDVEPLAADVRGADQKEMRKKLNKEKLRIMAQILQVPYDSLVQRDREYQTRKTLAISGSIMAVLAAFGIYAWSSNMRISALYNQSQLTLAKEKAQSALEQLENGDRYAAMETALSMRTASGKPLSQSLYYPLSQALQPYSSGNRYEFYPAQKIPLTDRSLDNTSFTDNGKYGAGFSNETVYITDMETGFIHWKLDIQDLETDQTEWHNVLRGVAAGGENQGLVWNDTTLWFVNLQDKTVQKTVPLNNGDSAGYQKIMKTDQGVWLVGHGCAYVDMARQELVQEWDVFAKLNLDPFSFYNNPAFAAQYYGSKLACIYENSQDEQVMVIVDYKNPDEIKSEKPKYATALNWLDDGSLLLLKERRDGQGNETGQSCVQQWKDGHFEEEWGSFYQSTGQQDQIFLLRFGADASRVPALACQNEVVILDTANRKVSDNCYFGSHVNQIFSLGNPNLFAVLTGWNRIGLADVNRSYSDSGNLAAVSYVLDSSLTLSNAQFIIKDGMLSALECEYSDNGTVGLIRFDSVSRKENGEIYDLQMDQDAAYLDAAQGEADGQAWILLTLDEIPNPQQVDGAEKADSAGYDDEIYQVVLLDRSAQKVCANLQIPVFSLKNKDREELPKNLGTYDRIQPNASLYNNKNGSGLIWCDGNALYRLPLDWSEQSEAVWAPDASNVIKQEWKDTVLGIAASPDGQRAIVCTLQGPAWLEWDEEKQAWSEQMGYLNGLPEGARYAKWTPDGKSAVIAGYDWIALRDGTTGQSVSIAGELYLADVQTSVFRGSFSVSGTAAGFRFAKSHPWLLCETETEKPAEDSETEQSAYTGYTPPETEQKLLFIDWTSGKIVKTIAPEEMGFSKFGSSILSKMDLTKEDSRLVSITRGLRQEVNPSISELTLYDLHANQVLLRQSIEPLTAYPSEFLEADNQGVFISLSRGGMIGYSVSEGSLSSPRQLLALEDDQYILMASLMDSEAVWMPQYDELIDVAGGKVLIDPIYGFEELARQAQQQIDERKTLQESAGGNTDH